MEKLFLCCCLCIMCVDGWWTTQRSTESQYRIIFVKTHKTGSSTVSSVLHRYCDEHGVTCYTQGPVGRNIDVFQYTNHWFTHTTFPNIDVYSYHIRYWPTLLRAFVSEPSPIITIMREPVARFLSGWDYASKHWKGKRNIIEIVREMPVELHRLPTSFRELLYANGYRQSLCPHAPSWAIRNASEPTCVQTLRDMRSGAISLVMITERMDESLLLLSRSMGWNINDLLYLSMKNNTRRTSDHPPADVVDKIRGWLHDDVLLYKAATDLFEQRIKDQDSSFSMELLQFKQLKTEAHMDCMTHRKHTYKIADPCMCSRMKLDHADWIQKSLHATTTQDCKNESIKVSH